MNVLEAVRKRQAVRAFRPDPVPVHLVRFLMDAARLAPSGGNLQPWRVYALTGEPLRHFKELITAKLDAGERETAEYAIYPRDLWEPFRARRRAAGVQRYEALGIGRADNGQAQLERLNYQFFGAPVGLFFCLDRRLGPPQWSDLGMYMQTLMLLAAGEGLATCPQEVWANWPKTIAAFLDLPADHMVFAGMSLGYADLASPMNGYRTAREPLESFATILGAEET
ncbi:NADH dehydrogenase [Agaricicola taiwanensis]|uniref:NADH dehydrogenase n=1 Tax=Agaricicola taiwanensis TaxID=591372 RepID=A0A8J3DVV0_9RHOB|nr:nitroreductase [Agaricicola taiwanensis]GGE45530.1 NADH dehydrogenase [Agaricicola taiwanensis]